MTRRGKTRAQPAAFYDALAQDAAYPHLAKKASDGMYCYVVQRRISPYISLFCVRRGISANAATAIDLLWALLAAGCLSQGYYISGVILIQLFGLWSCVDGEVARLTNTPSRLGDFYDTMTDRAAEFLIVAATLFSLPHTAATHSVTVFFFAYMGMIFLITASSEKFRSVYRKHYPKNEYERVFNGLCAGSDTRLLSLSAAILAYAFTGYVVIIECWLALMSSLLAINFLFRMWKIWTQPVENDTSSQ
jgi:phosphatidylglycerophosphate synthase